MSDTDTPLCPHYSGYRYINPPVYPEQADLKPGQMWCWDCQTIVPDPVLEQARQDAMEPCLHAGSGSCRGAVSGRLSYAGTGTIIYECARHMDESALREAQIRRDYPDQQPADFDPYFAGESWYGDDDGPLTPSR